jgi:S1-C subfamily serine protease
MDYIALVPTDLADLIPEFLSNRGRETHELQAAINKRDFPDLRLLGERMYAVGNPYGFRQVTTFGRQIREACATEDLPSIADVLSQYEDYLGKLQIIAVNAPIERPCWPRPEQPPPGERFQRGGALRFRRAERP